MPILVYCGNSDNEKNKKQFFFQIFFFENLLGRPQVEIKTQFFENFEKT